MADKDPNQMAAEKLDKETKKFQEKQRQQFDMPRKNMPTENDMGPKQEPIANRGKLPVPQGYSPNKTPEPTFKSDVDNIISGAKKVNKKINDTVDQVVTKAAGKTEKGILNSGFSRDFPEAKKKGGMIKKMAKGGSASSRADGCATKGKTRGRIV